MAALDLYDKSVIAIEKLKSIKNKGRINKLTIESKIIKEEKIATIWYDFYKSDDFKKFTRINEIDLMQNPGIGGIGNYITFKSESPEKFSKF